MARDPRYNILFEPMQIGPVTAKNRFYQVPHCTGMGWLRPQTLAAMREVKAEGGWGVVCTEYASIHPTSDDLPYPSAALWDDTDIRTHALMTEKVHAHGALAGVELWAGGARSTNLLTRLTPLDVDSLPNLAGNPYQTRAMDKTDIRDLRRWHRKAALRARDAGFDIVYVYATHGYLLSHFLDPVTNTRSDEYGGSLENRVRLVRELITETKDAVGDRCAVAVRFAADECVGDDGVPVYGERREMFELLAELPDLWDINIADYSLEMGASRFTQEAALEPYMSFVKAVTSKPVVTVGRFTSPDTMASQLRRGITDFIGAARPSIADPFLPQKIERGAVNSIRECIGCNVCYAGDSLGIPIRCTQNPTMGEEWRKGWHPERVQAKGSESRVLIVGSGPAGLEAALTLGKRGYAVMLAEAGLELGGRVLTESGLPGMSEYIRVRDYREQQLLQLPNVEIFRDNRLTADEVLALGTEVDHVALATGAHWRKDYFNGKTYVPVCSIDAADGGVNAGIGAAMQAAILTPDDIMAGRLPIGPVLVFDDDNYYMGGVIAERLVQAGLEVTLCTPSDSISEWAKHTAERWRIRTRLHQLGVKLITGHRLTWFANDVSQGIIEGPPSLKESRKSQIHPNSLKHRFDKRLMPKEGGCQQNQALAGAPPPLAKGERGGFKASEAAKVGEATLNCQYSNAELKLPIASVVMVTQRKPNDALYQALLQQVDGDVECLPFSLQRIGDCEAPAIIAAAVYAGHRYAQELDNPTDLDVPLKHERVDVLTPIVGAGAGAISGR